MNNELLANNTENQKILEIVQQSFSVKTNQESQISLYDLWMFNKSVKETLENQIQNQIEIKSKSNRNHS